MPQAIVIDDSPLIRAQLKQILARLDCRVVAEAGSGDDLRRLYDLHKPDLVTLDIVMPGKDGLTAAVELMREHPTAKIVMCTSLTTRDKILACQRACVCHYLLKPFAPARAEEIFKFALARETTPVRSVS